MVVANDVDTERAYMLVKQCRRLNSASLLITCHPGQLLPGLDWPDDGAEGYFDRVLCDVPCSGDGTLRKNPMIWSKWTPASGMALHPLQLQIALRGLGLLRIGGMLVYSTCSLSPMEDEAVVAEILRRHRGQVELVDARQFLPGFKCRPGMTSWKVMDAPPKGRPHASKREREQAAAAATKQQQQLNPAELPEDPVERSVALGFSVFHSFEEVPEELQSRVRTSVFPPTEEENEWMNLRHCLRCVPHDEDTGGFFVALLRKVCVRCSSESS
jgi:tRNA (cytosine34-C5)-methyltransferase